MLFGVCAGLAFIVLPSCATTTRMTDYDDDAVALANRVVQLTGVDVTLTSFQQAVVLAATTSLLLVAAEAALGVRLDASRAPEAREKSLETVARALGAATRDRSLAHVSGARILAGEPDAVLRLFEAIDALSRRGGGAGAPLEERPRSAVSSSPTPSDDAAEDADTAAGRRRGGGGGRGPAGGARRAAAQNGPRKSELRDALAQVRALLHALERGSTGGQHRRRAGEALARGDSSHTALHDAAQPPLEQPPWVPNGPPQPTRPARAPPPPAARAATREEDALYRVPDSFSPRTPPPPPPTSTFASARERAAAEAAAARVAAARAAYAYLEPPPPLRPATERARPRPQPPPPPHFSFRRRSILSLLPQHTHGALPRPATAPAPPRRVSHPHPHPPPPPHEPRPPHAPTGPTGPTDGERSMSDLRRCAGLDADLAARLRALLALQRAEAERAAASAAASAAAAAAGLGEEAAAAAAAEVLRGKGARAAARTQPHSFVFAALSQLTRSVLLSQSPRRRPARPRPARSPLRRPPPATRRTRSAGRRWRRAAPPWRRRARRRRPRRGRRRRTTRSFGRASCAPSRRSAPPSSTRGACALRPERGCMSHAVAPNTLPYRSHSPQRRKRLRVLSFTRSSSGFLSSRDRARSHPRRPRFERLRVLMIAPRSLRLPPCWV